MKVNIYKFNDDEGELVIFKKNIEIQDNPHSEEGIVNLEELDERIDRSRKQI